MDAEEIFKSDHDRILDELIKTAHDARVYHDFIQSNMALNLAQQFAVNFRATEANINFANKNVDKGAAEHRRGGIAGLDED